MKSPEEKTKTDGNSNGISRRDFLKSVSLTSMGAAAVPSVHVLERLRESGVLAPEGKLLGPQVVSYTLTVNGKRHQVKAEPRMTLADVLRDQLGLTGTKIGCDRGACGACTVIMAGKTVTSCLVLALDAMGQEIETIEGLGAPDGTLHAIQESFIEHDGMQCGFCTSGMIMSCKNLLDHNPNPTLEETKVATSGNLCRCGTYPKVFDAVLAARKK